MTDDPSAAPGVKTQSDAINWTSAVFGGHLPHTSGYAGFPAANTACKIAREVLTKELGV